MPLFITLTKEYYGHCLMFSLHPMQVAFQPLSINLKNALSSFSFSYEVVAWSVDVHMPCGIYDHSLHSTYEESL
jgi:hypothetical protein